MITVRKRDHTGSIVFEYTGRILRQAPDHVLLEARFNRSDLPFQDTTFRQGDRFVEIFYTDRWYNIFEIHDRDDDTLKGWYCNIGLPAVWDTPAIISYIDLALDLWVTPAGLQIVLDEDEFAALNLDESTRLTALSALADLRALFKSKQPAPGHGLF